MVVVSLFLARLFRGSFDHFIHYISKEITFVKPRGERDIIVQSREERERKTRARVIERIRQREGERRGCFFDHHHHHHGWSRAGASRRRGKDGAPQSERERSSSGKKIGGAMDDADGESTFHYLSSIVVSALALTGAVIGVESVWQRCKSGNCNPGSFLLPGDHRYYHAFV